MENEVETWDSALFARAILKYSVYHGTGNRFLFQFYLSSGMLLSCVALMHTDDSKYSKLRGLILCNSNL